MKGKQFRIIVPAIWVMVLCTAACVKRENTTVEPAQSPAGPAAVEDTVVKTVTETVESSADVVKNAVTGTSAFDTAQKINALEEPLDVDIHALSKEGDELVEQTDTKAVELRDKVEQQAAALREQMENNEKMNVLKSKAQSAFDSMEDALEGF
jgi:hypothetical protein